MQWFRQCAALAALSVTLVWNAPTFAADKAENKPVPSAENGMGMARHWSNITGFVGSCLQKDLLDKSNANVKYVKFGSYLGHFLIGSMLRETRGTNSLLASYLAEGAKGHVHEFDEKGNFVAFDIEFTKKNCATLSKGLETAYEQFSKSVHSE